MLSIEKLIKTTQILEYATSKIKKNSNYACINSYINLFVFLFYVYFSNYMKKTLIILKFQHVLTNVIKKAESFVT